MYPRIYFPWRNKETTDPAVIPPSVTLGGMRRPQLQVPFSFQPGVMYGLWRSPSWLRDGSGGSIGNGLLCGVVVPLFGHDGLLLKHVEGLLDGGAN